MAKDKAPKSKQEEPIEKQLWKAADKLRRYRGKGVAD